MVIRHMSALHVIWDRAKPTLCFVSLCVLAMPSIGMADETDSAPALEIYNNSLDTILNKDHLFNYYHKAPAAESSVDSSTENSTVLDGVVQDFSARVDLFPDTDIDKQPRQREIVAEVAIIIDDIGYSRSQGLAAINISGDLTYAIIPHSPYAKFLATFANQQRKEVILHAPMSNIHNHSMGKSGLTEAMGEADFDSTLLDAMASVPHIRGVNNHMGSLLTQTQRPMDWTMKTLKANGLFFIDSRTTAASVAWETAQRYDIASLERDVFLDHERDSLFIEEQFERFITIAKRNGYAIAIAHPYSETIQYLIDNLHRLQAHGIRLVPASELVNHYSPNRVQQGKM